MYFKGSCKILSNSPVKILFFGSVSLRMQATQIKSLLSRNVRKWKQKTIHRSETRSTCISKFTVSYNTRVFSTYKKKAYAVFNTLKQMEYILACSNDVTIFTDHRNLLFTTFHPTANEPSLGRQKVQTMIPWDALYLAFYIQN